MRLFIGIDLPPELKDAILEFQSELRRLGVDGSWKSRENFHITLEFLGELESQRMASLTETLANVAQNHQPFRLSIAGLGAFPSLARPHTLWAAVSGNLVELDRLRDEIHHELAKRGFTLEDRAFKPHITLASRPQLDGTEISGVLAKKLGEFTVADVVLFESKIVQGKRRYPDLYRATLVTLDVQ